MQENWCFIITHCDKKKKQKTKKQQKKKKKKKKIIIGVAEVKSRSNSTPVIFLH